MSTPDIRGVCALVAVYDMPRSLAFYRDVLGFEIAMRSPTYAAADGVELFHWALLRRGDVELMLNTAYDEGQRPPSPDESRRAAHEDVTLYFVCPDVDAAYAAVTALGVTCAPPRTAPYGMRQLSFKDPDGYGVVLQHPAVG